MYRLTELRNLLSVLLDDVKNNGVNLLGHVGLRLQPIAHFLENLRTLRFGRWRHLQRRRSLKIVQKASLERKISVKRESILTEQSSWGGNFASFSSQPFFDIIEFEEFYNNNRVFETEK